MYNFCGSILVMFDSRSEKFGILSISDNKFKLILDCLLIIDLIALINLASISTLISLSSLLDIISLYSLSIES